MRSRVWIWALAATVLVTHAAAPAGAAGAEATRPAAPAGDGLCPVSPDVIALDGSETLYAIRMSGLETGIASGTLAMYAGLTRYDVPFHDAVVAAMRDRTTQPTPIVVRFASPVRLDGAAVTSLAGGTTDCAVPFSPWLRHRIGDEPQVVSAADARWSSAFLAAAARTVPVNALPAIEDPAPCVDPYRLGTTVAAATPTMSRIDRERGVHAIVGVLILLRPDDSIAKTELLHSSGNPRLDAEALRTTARSTFRTARFRCRPTFGAYEFLVRFLS